MYIYTCVCVDVCMGVCACVHVCIYLCVDRYIFIVTFPHVCVCACLSLDLVIDSNYLDEQRKT